MNSSIPPCFFCQDPAEYIGETVETDGKFETVEVCKLHFKGSIEASS